MIYLAADHRGFELKEIIKTYLMQEGHTIEDVGAFVYDQKDDYVDFARAASEKIAADSERHKGIFICGSGHGMDMVANKYKGLRAALCFNQQVAKQSREHENANVLVLASDWVNPDAAKEIITTWLSTSFTEEERNVRRLGKVKEIEDKNFSADGGSVFGGK